MVQPTSFLSGSIPISEAWGLDLGSHYVYWIDEHAPLALKQVALVGEPTVAIVAKGSFPMGIISDIMISKNERWLLFIDRETSYIGGDWKLQALDLQTNQQKTVFEASGYPYEDTPIESLAKIWIGVGQDDVALSYALTPEANECQRIVLRVVNLVDTTNKVVKEANCAKEETIWVWPDLESNFLAVDQDYSVVAGGGIDVLLYDLRTEKIQLLTEDRLSSSPKISSKYVIWKRAYRSDYGRSLGVYDRQTKQFDVIDFPTLFPKPSLNESWVYWFPEFYQSLYVYDLRHKHFVQVTKSDCKQVISHVAMKQSILTWVRKDMEKNQEFLEWRDVGQLPPSDFIHCDPPKV